MRLEFAGFYESDLVAPEVRLQDPGDFFHFVDRGLAPIRVTGAEIDRERDAAIVGQAAAFDDLLAQTLTFDDSREPA